MNTEDKDHNAKIVAGVKFVSTKSKDRTKIVVEVKFVSTTSKDCIVKIVVEVKFVSTTR